MWSRKLVDILHMVGCYIKKQEKNALVLYPLLHNIAGILYILYQNCHRSLSIIFKVSTVLSFLNILFSPVWLHCTCIFFLYTKMCVRLGLPRPMSVFSQITEWKNNTSTVSYDR